MPKFTLRRFFIWITLLCVILGLTQQFDGIEFKRAYYESPGGVWVWAYHHPKTGRWKKIHNIHTIGFYYREGRFAENYGRFELIYETYPPTQNN